MWYPQHKLQHNWVINHNRPIWVLKRKIPLVRYHRVHRSIMVLQRVAWKQIIRAYILYYAKTSLKNSEQIKIHWFIFNKEMTLLISVGILMYLNCNGIQSRLYTHTSLSIYDSWILNTNTVTKTTNHLLSTHFL